MCLTVLGNFDLHELELDFFINCITISLQIESPGEVKLSCASRSVTSTRWDAEGGPLVNRVECDCDSIWEVLVGNWSPTPSCLPSVLENNKNFLQKWLRCRDGIKSTETSCHTAKQNLVVGHTCKGVAPYPYIWLVAEGSTVTL